MIIAAHTIQNQLTIAQSATDSTALLLLVAAVIIFFLQVAFVTMEAGVVRSAGSLLDLMFKNMLVISVTAIIFWLVGFAFAIGDQRVGNNVRVVALLTRAHPLPPATVTRLLTHGPHSAELSCNLTAR